MVIMVVNIISYKRLKCLHRGKPNMQITHLLKSKGLSLFKHGKGSVVSNLINNLQGMVCFLTTEGNVQCFVTCQ